MTVLFTEGFDTYANTTAGDWTIVTNAQSYTTGRFGVGQCLSSGGGDQVTPAFSAQSALIAGIAISPTSWAGGSSGTNFLSMLSGGNSNTTNRQLSLQITNAGLLQVTNGTTTWSTGVTLAIGNWYYVELKVNSFNATTGSFNVYVEGALVLTQTNVNTAAASGAPSTADRIDVNAANPNSATLKFDDFYVGDTLLGPCRIDTLRPAADSGTPQWTRNTGATNASAVNETQVNNDTTYVSDATVGDQDLYTVSALPVTPASIFAVTQKYVARKDDVGARQIAGLVKSSATTSQDATQTMNTTYNQFRRVLNTDPNGSIAWTPTAVNALLIGQKTIA